ncbi:response regulator [Aquitalea magnusonii]|uniref:Hpt domain-containing response regulator n=1 Tax=Aquitalea magnusonii TaxID=332411 RepID=UPI00142DA968|nr:response regulator [Aquitalea magnusonii]
MNNPLHSAVSESGPAAYGAAESQALPAGDLWAHGLQPRVLVAEDNLANLFLLNSQLQRLGCEVLGVSNGLEALTQWRQGQFDCLLTDLGMPQLDGFCLVRQLRKDGDMRPVIGISADPGEQERQRAAEAGFNILLAKPVSLSVLHTTLLRFALASSMQRLPVYMDDSLAALFDGDAGLMKKFVARLLDSNRQDLAEAFVLYGQQQWGELAQVLHKIKGAARLIDAQQVARDCEQMEKACKAANQEQVGILLEDLRLRLQTLEDSLQAKAML